MPDSGAIHTGVRGVCVERETEIESEVEILLMLISAPVWQELVTELGQCHLMQTVTKDCLRQRQGEGHVVGMMSE